MKLPLWVYDYKQKRYVVFPFHLLETSPDGRRGFDYNLGSAVHHKLLTNFGHLFVKEFTSNMPSATLGLGVLYTNVRFILKERPEAPKPKGPRWYSKDEHQIKRFKRKGARR
jgi:hypothetical protein